MSQNLHRNYFFVNLRAVIILEFLDDEHKNIQDNHKLTHSKAIHFHLYLDVSLSYEYFIFQNKLSSFRYVNEFISNDQTEQKEQHISIFLSHDVSLLHVPQTCVICMFAFL